jgi:para-nitrobenzyl esterase
MSSIAQTRHGQVEGAREGDLVVFKGIPYAAPPVGSRRWMPPAPAEPWTGIRKAQQFGPAAPQNPIPLDILPAFNVGDSMEEDCLYLNVWTPALDAAKRPVMFWIHGGAFVIGSGAQTLYDGSVLAKRGDVVVVTINYRLGPLGFLNLNEVTGGLIPSTGNEGLLDQIEALEWVRENIADFGGDPENVTIFGESAGGMSVGCQLALPRARGLFQKAIPQSGACGTANTMERAIRVAERVLGALDVRADDVDGLRAASVEQLLHIQATLGTPGQTDPDIGGMPFQPCVDGDVLPELPIELVRKGSAAGIPVLVGTTLEEWELFGAADPTIFTLHEDELVRRVGENVGAESALGLVDAYRKARSGRGEPVTPTDLWLAIETDRIFRIAALQLADTQRAVGTPAHSYLFTWKSPAMGGMLGACHALELGFVFGTIDSAGARDFSGSGAGADALEDMIQAAWLAFAHSGDPSTDAQPWPAYGERRETMVLDAKSEVQTAPYDDERRAWDAIEGAGRL